MARRATGTSRRVLFQTSVQFTREQLARIDALAEDAHVGRAILVRQLVDEALKARERARQIVAAVEGAA